MKTIAEKDFINNLRSISCQTKNKKIIVSLNMMRLGFPLFKFEKIIDMMINVLDPKELAIQSYSNFDSNNPRVFYKYTSPVTKNLSSLSKEAFRKNPQLRLLSPTHSFIVFKANKEIYNYIFTSAFGKNSIFEYFYKNNYFWLNIGCYLNETCTFMHHVEALNANLINYRKNEKFPVMIFEERDCKESKLIQYEYFTKVKSLNFMHSWIPIQNTKELEYSIMDKEYPISFYNLPELFIIGSKMLYLNPKVFIKNYMKNEKSK